MPSLPERPLKSSPSAGNLPTRAESPPGPRDAGTGDIAPVAARNPSAREAAGEALPPQLGDVAEATRAAPPAPESETRPRPWYTDRLVWATFIVAIALDQISKAAVASTMRLGESVPAEGFLRLTHARNSGAAFGLFQNQGMILTIVAFVAVAGMIYFFRNAPLPSLLMKIALGMQLGGALGNLADRLQHGYVVDFIDVGPWPIFNLADSFITVGIVILFWTVTRPDSDAAAGEPSVAQGEQPAGEASETRAASGTLDPGSN